MTDPNEAATLLGELEAAGIVRIERDASRVVLVIQGEGEESCTAADIVAKLRALRERAPLPPIQPMDVRLQEELRALCLATDRARLEERAKLDAAMAAGLLGMDFGVSGPRNRAERRARRKR